VRSLFESNNAKESMIFTSPDSLNAGGFSKQLLQRPCHSKERRKNHFNYMKILRKLILMSGLGIGKKSAKKTKYGF
jgi:hypothetical protein